MGKFFRIEEMILFEDEHYIVINKPPFLSSLDERFGVDRKVSVLSLARDYHEGAQLCHRLDKETSGALVIAKHPEAYRHLAIQFEHREVKKEYHAVAEGVHSFENHVVNLPIFPKPQKGIVRIDWAQGKPAITVFNTLRNYRDYTLVQCFPVTGRLHQIRIHLASIGAPIVCDETYGGQWLYLSQLKHRYNLKKDSEELPVIQRFALHAHKIAFRNMDDSPVEIEAPYPKDFAVLVKHLERWNS
ncbi:MAG: RNA pseudouridine synthase [Thermonema sp.]|uniref:RluA family pseudouridine synthase n=1 Tax=Thermonema sp. TaxID=2231181 RepID=UPI0021DD67A8|nr:RluA family pseudouridine synthase [Thermonema sp.]GIV40105.1 MAG: RNA pseudouridine synthase [Thermonema sp.]